MIFEEFYNDLAAKASKLEKIEEERIFSIIRTLNNSSEHSAVEHKSRIYAIIIHFHKINKIPMKHKESGGYVILSKENISDPNLRKIIYQYYLNNS